MVVVVFSVGADEPVEGDDAKPDAKKAENLPLGTFLTLQGIGTLNNVGLSKTLPSNP